jgi:hypothetical protein
MNHILKSGYTIKIPHNHEGEFPQNEEYVVIENTNTHDVDKVKLHDYGKIYAIPGLYEYLYYNQLKCRSPEKICELLKQVIENESLDMSQLQVLDIGAGNGLVGEQLHLLGIRNIYGIDIESEAKKAVERDRPNIYKNYYLADLTKISVSVLSKLKEKSLNCMTVVAALGFNDIPPKAFAIGFNLLSTEALVAFNIKEEFLSIDKSMNKSTDFSVFINRMIQDNVIENYSKILYQHRLSIQNKPIYYYAIVANKNRNIPVGWFL